MRQNVKHNHCSSSFSANSKLSKGFSICTSRPYSMSITAIRTVCRCLPANVPIMLPMCFTVSHLADCFRRSGAVNYSADFVFNHFEDRWHGFTFFGQLGCGLSVTGTIGEWISRMPFRMTTTSCSPPGRECPALRFLHCAEIEEARAGSLFTKYLQSSHIFVTSYGSGILYIHRHIPASSA